MQVFHNTPSAGYIAWQDVHIQYKGVTYNIPNGNTNKKYVYWLYSSPDMFQTSDTMPSLGPDDLLVFLNKNGTYAIVPKTQLVDGSLIVSESVMTDALAANSVTAAKIAAGAVTADKVAANAIGAGAIAAGAVIADKIAAGAVTADKLAALSVTADKIAAGAISADKLSVGLEIDADSHPIRAASNQIWLDETGLNMKNASVSNILMNLNAERLGFWDPDGLPTIGLGAVQEMAQQLGISGFLYGLLIAQGIIVAHQGVLGDALTDFGTTRNKIEDKSVNMDKLDEGSVTIGKLSDVLSVTIPDRLQRFRYDEAPSLLENPGFETGTLSGWTAVPLNANFNYYIVSTSPHSGSYHLRFFCKGYIYQERVASEGQVWELGAFTRRYYTGVCRICLQFLDSSGNPVGEADKTLTPDSWTGTIVRATAPAGTAKVRARLEQTDPGASAYADFDDAWLAQGSGSLIDTTYRTFYECTIPASECIEQLKITHAFVNWPGNTTTVRCFINGQQQYELESTSTEPIWGTTLDVRDISGDLTIQLQAKSSSPYARWTSVELMQNQRLPIRGAAPVYSVTETTESSCGATCEHSCQTSCQKSCQSSCQRSCQSSCQASCQTACQKSCQSTCELTAQGGGCFVEGTLVSIYDAEPREIREVPIETLTPGTLMPAYNPDTDSIEVTECISNMKSKTGTLHVIEVEGGHVLRATGEQPFDVLRANKLTGQLGWYKVPARYLAPDDLLIRPFEPTDKLRRVIRVTQTLVPPTWVWNPKTANRRYIVEGFADPLGKE